VKLRLLSDIAWVTAGQAASAGGTLVGVRLLTQFASPATFGTASLALGAAALAMNVACTPLTQSVLHFYPSLAGTGAARDLRAAMYRALRRVGWRGLWVAVLAGAVYTGLYSGSITLVAVLTLLLVTDCWRSAELVLANAARGHRRYALWLSADAWLRPLLATAAILTLGESASVMLSAYLVASAILIAVFTLAWPQRHPPSATVAQTNAKASTTAGAAGLDARLWHYALPLFPLGLISWANGLGDRYIIGGVLSVGDAGVYAAAYGLASRPLLMLSGAIELAIRPVYQAAVSAGDSARANRLLLFWFAAIAGAGAACVAAITVWNTQLAALLLGPQFRRGAVLMPWIAAGYCLLTVSYVFERVCYAHGRTSRVLLIQSCTAAAAAIATTVGTLEWGLIGAAVAVPIYFSVQLAVAALQALQTVQPTVALRMAQAQHGVGK
jgi:O-antigen/teichoic acid export membrane protein